MLTIHERGRRIDGKESGEVQSLAKVGETRDPDLQVSRRLMILLIWMTVIADIQQANVLVDINGAVWSLWSVEVIF